MAGSRIDSSSLTGPKPSTPWSELVIALFCATFAVWTLCSQVVVALGGSFLHLLFTALVLTGAVLAAAVARGLRSSLQLLVRTMSRPSAPSFAERPARWEVDLTTDRPDRLAVRRATLVAAIVAVTLGRNNPQLLWWSIAGCLAVGALSSFTTEPAAVPAPEHRRRQELVLWGLAVACACYGLVCHRPDADDSFYINVAVSAAERPDLPLFGSDTLHGLSSLGAPLPVYKVHSWELLNGAFALLLDISALSAFHLLSAALVSILAPLAWASLLRRLTPRSWLLGVATLLVVLIVVGDVHRWYGNFAFVRIWQGKALFLTVFLPLIWSYALRFGQRPTWSSGLWLAASQIAAVGATSSALWAAPAAAGAALIAVLSRRRMWLALAGLGAVSSYAFALALALRPAMQRLAERAAELDGSAGTLLGEAIDTVLGHGPLMVLSLIALAAAWTVAPAGPARRFASITPLVLWVSLLNPYLGQMVAVHLTGPSYWRTMWVLPVPLLLALLITAPLHRSPRNPREARVGGLSAIAAWLALLSAFTVWVPRIHGWSPKNQGNRIGAPSHKIPPEAHLARLVRNHVSAGTVVVAPPNVNVWLPVLNDRPYPLKVLDYLQLHGYPRRDRVGMIQVAFLGGRTARGVDEFRHGLHRFHVGAVLFYLREPEGDERLRNALGKAGFDPVDEGTGWELWLRHRGDPRGDPFPDQPLQFPFFAR